MCIVTYRVKFVHYITENSYNTKVVQYGHFMSYPKLCELNKVTMNYLHLRWGYQ